MKTVKIQVEIPTVIHELLTQVSAESSVKRSTLYGWLIIDASIHEPHLNNFMRSQKVHPANVLRMILKQRTAQKSILSGDYINAD